MPKFHEKFHWPLISHHHYNIYKAIRNNVEHFDSKTFGQVLHAVMHTSEITAEAKVLRERRRKNGGLCWCENGNTVLIKRRLLHLVQLEYVSLYYNLKIVKVFSFPSWIKPILFLIRLLIQFFRAFCVTVHDGENGWCRRDKTGHEFHGNGKGKIFIEKKRSNN